MKVGQSDGHGNNLLYVGFNQDQGKGILFLAH